MTRLVIDASVAIKWFIRSKNEEHVPKAVEILEGIGDNRISIIQPPHWMAETIAVLARLQPDKVARAIDLLDAMEIPVKATASEYKLASRMALDLDHHLFDTLYHALALREEATLITADRQYFNKAAGLGLINMLSDFYAKLPSPAEDEKSPND
jgi:predicted nucleic acid-binding protein